MKSCFILTNTPFKNTLTSILNEAWECVTKYRKLLGSADSKYDIWNLDYETITEKVEEDFIIRQEIKNIREKRLTDVLLITGYNKDDRDMLEKVRNKYNIQNNDIIIYTDDSKPENSRSTGAGIILEDQKNGDSISLPSQCSTFTAEAFAIKAALEIVAKDNKSTKKNIIIIFSDCKAVLQAINNNRLNTYHNKYILNIKEISSKLKKEKKMRILLIWIPSHRGITGNELADHLAKGCSRRK